MRRLIAVLLCYMICLPSRAQKINDRFELNIQKISEAIRVDGLADEAVWANAALARDFHMVLPMDTSLAKVKTEVRMVYDDKAIYILATCFVSEPGTYVVESLRRDFNFGKNDNFIFYIDPFDDRTNGFTFGTNAAGAQWDGLIYDGGKADLSWENKWVSAVKNYNDRWVMEAAIPFKSIRFKKGINKWGVNFSRNDLKANEKSAWAPVPRQFPTVSLAYSGNLVWDEPPPSAGANISLIPYVLGGVSRNYEKNKPNDFRKEIGGDAKISITSSLNLDLTVNPDFSQVEVDKQVTNLDRFELFFPERRQFFLENADLFGNVGYTNIRPFFSRRIGLDVPIQFGARLSGRINKDWRMGVMDMQTKGVKERDLPAQNFAVVTLQRKVFARSNIGFMFVNKESLHYTPDNLPETPKSTPYNRNFGLEYNLASPSNFYTGKFLLFKSFSPGKTDKTISHAANLNYTSRHWAVGWQHEYVGKNYIAEVGYVPRTGYVKFNPQVAYLLFPRGSKVLSHGPILLSNYYMDESFRKTDAESSVAYKLNFRNQANITATLTRNYISLLRPFDPTNTGKDSLQVGSIHQFTGYSVDFFSRPQKLFTIAASARYGGYYAGGKRWQAMTELGYRFQPFVSILMSASFNALQLPKPWGNQNFWLVGPRVDVTMTNKIFFTAFGQYNEQTKNFNLNTRLQWRYRPASDFFIVYTDNYLPENLSIRNRALVVKFTYWFSL
jgi:Domain of unknown function (DUF5916)/Carbohydrate family 9 binding domain-like